jgi:CubicO group peptidase (beta-lactamase class C family)
VPAFEALDAFAASVLEVGTAPALAVAITDRDRTLTARTYGAAAPDALWPIASIGKSFTAVLVLQLVEEGVLDLHAPVTDYVPWLPIDSSLHHLLTHTSGLVETSNLAPASTYDVIALAGVEPGFAPGRAPLVLGHRLPGRRRHPRDRDRRAVRRAAAAPRARSAWPPRQRPGDAPRDAAPAARRPRSVLR